MEALKRTHFQASHPGVAFPDVSTLSHESAENLRTRLAARLGCDCANGLTLVKTLAGRATVVEGVNAQSEDFRLLQTLWTLQLRPKETVYLNWYRFDSIDIISLEDLAQYFQDLWYPSSDDLDVFDDTLDWVLSIGHSGDLSIARLGLRDVAGTAKLKKPV